MTYATLQTLVDQVGIDELTRSSDRDGDGVADVGVIDRALEDAAAEIDSYVGVKYKLPLNPVPAVVITHSGSIALYRMSLETATWTEEKRRRYDDALRWLRDVAKGLASLDGEVAAQPKSSGGIRYFTEAREYSRDKLGGVL
jgi:phage gp36-like protein